ncbi:hypothetical protein ACQKLP_10995 [Chitinophaga sp. NPDC101104]|uniref:hypothetical protein n=1 Tax=Chitinophaga sp. NPDC101104 TaxID=3390561 RepID=UPI003CFCF88E
MAQFKRKSLMLSSGKQIKMTGTALCILPSLEIGEGFTNNIFGVNEAIGENQKAIVTLTNPYQLSPADVQEIALLHIRYWLDLIDAVGEFGTKDATIFRKKE